MRRAKWFYHPISVFIFSIFALGLSLFLYIYWYMKVSTGLEAIVRRFDIDPKQVLEYQNWVVILVLSVLVGIILMGIFTIFVYNQKNLQLYRLQNNFINNFTHELKTPVTSLRLYLETFLKHELSREQQVRYTRYMLQDVSRLSDNINRILDLARIESRSYGGNFVPVDIVNVTEHFHMQNGHLFQNCEIEIHRPESGAFLHPVNVPLFEMLLMNLLTNAIKYNRSATPRVDIFFERHKKEICVRFRDNGIGIGKTDIRKIFRKFYQAGHSDDMTARGSGLGLYLVQIISRLHKGRMEARSEGPEKGTEFILKLPSKR